MKKIIAPVVGALLLASTAAFAWSNVSGKITRIDMDQHQVTLDNGTTYVAQDGVDLSSIQVGDKVTVTAESQNGKVVFNKIVKS